jgi:parvulin-like peptidyl-prolyl cis-trans isomerase-like protein
LKLHKDPLLHFVVAGAILFAGYVLINRDQTNPPSTDPVRVGAGEVRWLKETFANQWQRTPTDDELRGLVAGFLEEELLAREAKTLGLDQNDTIVRRRLAQKLAFLIDDTSRVAEASDEDLRQFYNTNAERFRVEPRVSLTQIFFNPERRQHAETDAKAALALISTAGGDDRAATMGDRTLLETEFHDVDAQTISNLFGPDFARTVFLLKPGSWAGPVKSSYGVHLVRTTDLRPAALRSFEEVRQKVQEEWRRQREDETKAQYLDKLREKYGVVIDESARPLTSSPPAEAKMQ